jgi:hypothetical protein
MHPSLRPLFNSMRLVASPQPRQAIRRSAGLRAVLREELGGHEGDFVRHRKPRKEIIMKCSHPMCDRGIGLVSHRRWFGKGLYCSCRCRDNYATAPTRPKPPLSVDARLFAWLFASPNAHSDRRLAAATIRVQRH